MGFADASFLIMSLRSSGGGLSRKTRYPYPSGDFHHPAGSIRDSTLLRMNGRVRYVLFAWQDCRFESARKASDIVFSTSSDAARSSRLNRIPIKVDPDRRRSRGRGSA